MWRWRRGPMTVPRSDFQWMKCEIWMLLQNTRMQFFFSKRVTEKTINLPCKHNSNIQTKKSAIYKIMKKMKMKRCEVPRGIGQRYSFNHQSIFISEFWLRSQKRSLIEHYLTIETSRKKLPQALNTIFFSMYACTFIKSEYRFKLHALVILVGTISFKVKNT